MGLKIAVAGIAKAKTKGSFKEKEVSGTEERLFIPNVKDPKVLKKGSALYRLITQMRDEAHRFSRRLHHHKEKGKMMGSWLDQVPGIGHFKTKIKIMEKLDLPRQEIQNFSVEEIQQKLDVSKKNRGEDILFPKRRMIWVKLFSERFKSYKHQLLVWLLKVGEYPTKNL